MSKHKHHDVIIAYANGEPIQYRREYMGGEWVDYTTSSQVNFDRSDIQWRIKPKETIKTYRMALVCIKDRHVVVAVDVTNACIDAPAEYDVQGFVEWVGPVSEVRYVRSKK